MSLIITAGRIYYDTDMSHKRDQIIRASSGLPIKTKTIKESSSISETLLKRLLQNKPELVPYFRSYPELAKILDASMTKAQKLQLLHKVFKQADIPIELRDLLTDLVNSFKFSHILKEPQAISGDSKEQIDLMSKTAGINLYNELARNSAFTDDINSLMTGTFTPDIVQKLKNAGYGYIEVMQFLKDAFKNPSTDQVLDIQQTVDYLFNPLAEIPIEPEIRGIPPDFGDVDMPPPETEPIPFAPETTPIDPDVRQAMQEGRRGIASLPPRGEVPDAPADEPRLILPPLPPLQPLQPLPPSPRDIPPVDIKQLPPLPPSPRIDMQQLPPLPPSPSAISPEGHPPLPTKPLSMKREELEQLPPLPTNTFLPESQDIISELVPEFDSPPDMFTPEQAHAIIHAGNGNDDPQTESYGRGQPQMVAEADRIENEVQNDAPPPLGQDKGLSAAIKEILRIDKLADEAVDRLILGYLRKAQGKIEVTQATIESLRNLKTKYPDEDHIDLNDEIKNMETLLSAQKEALEKREELPSALTIEDILKRDRTPIEDTPRTEPVNRKEEETEPAPAASGGRPPDREAAAQPATDAAKTESKQTGGLRPLGVHTPIREPDGEWKKSIPQIVTKPESGKKVTPVKDRPALFEPVIDQIKKDVDDKTITREEGLQRIRHLGREMDKVFNSEQARKILQASGIRKKFESVSHAIAPPEDSLKSGKIKRKKKKGEGKGLFEELQDNHKKLFGTDLYKLPYDDEEPEGGVIVEEPPKPIKNGRPSKSISEMIPTTPADREMLEKKGYVYEDDAGKVKADTEELQGKMQTDLGHQIAGVLPRIKKYPKSISEHKLWRNLSISKPMLPMKKQIKTSGKDKVNNDMKFLKNFIIERKK